MDYRFGIKLTLSSAGLVVFCFAADHVIFNWEDRWSYFTHGTTLRALSDSLTHGLIGGWVWANIIVARGEWFTARHILEVAACVVIATALDVDHLIEAKSLSIKDALNLRKRPFAHNTSLILAVTAVLSLLLYACPSLRPKPLARDIPLMFFTAALSHHLRDADRRGLWFAPFSSTPPIPLKMYPFLIALMPLAVSAVLKLPPVIVAALPSVRERMRTRIGGDITVV